MAVVRVKGNEMAEISNLLEQTSSKLMSRMSLTQSVAKQMDLF